MERSGIWLSGVVVLHKLSWINVALAVIVILLGGQAVAVAQASWEVTFHEDGSVTEVVRIPRGKEMLYQDPAWQTTLREGEDSVLYRKSETWRDYNQRQDRLPLTCNASNFIIFRNRSVIWDSNFRPNTARVAGLQNSDTLTIGVTLPGQILKSNGKIAGNTATWEIKPGLSKKPYIQSRQYNYLAIVAISLLVALVFTGFYLLKQVRKATLLINELEYEPEEESND